MRAEAGTTGGLAAYRILIVDDQPAQRKLTVLFFDQAGFDVESAEDGREGLKKVYDFRPDVVLSDVLMPRMDGFQLCMAIRADPGLSRIPVVLTTSRYLEPEDEQFGLRAGASCYVPHPPDLDALRRAVAGVLERGPANGAAAHPWLNPDYTRRLNRQVELLAADNAGQAAALQRAASDLASSEQRYGTLMENAQDAICILAPDGLILEVNRRSVELFGRSREEQVGHRFTEWFPPEIAARNLDAFKRSMAETGSTAAHDVAIPRPDGTVVYIDFHNQLVRIGDEQVVISIGRDITERRRAAQELQLLHSVALDMSEADDLPSALGALLAHVAETAAWEFGIVWLPEAGRGGLEARALWARGDPEAKRYRADVPPRLSRGEGLAGRAWESGIPIWSTDAQIDARVTRGKDAMVRLGLHAAAAVPVKLQGEAVAFIQCFALEPREEDARVLKLMAAIAAQAASLIRRKGAEEALRRSEDQLRQAQKMEAIGQLTGGIAHDFNNLLGVTIGNADLLISQLAEGDPRRLDAVEIKQAGERAAALTRQLLAFSRKQVLESRVVSLNDLVGGMEKMLRRVIGEQIRFSISLAPEGAQIDADPGQIEQVIMNLAVNARDAMPGGGDLRIETSTVDLDESYVLDHAPMKPGRYHLMSVSDTGCGMTAEVRRRVFEPFFTTKEKGRGTGLGLSTCYGIVKQSNGYIWVHSEPGQGTTFKVYLPSVDDLPQAEAPREVPGAAGGRETILVIEDEESMRLMVQKVLRRKGYSVRLARDAAEALDICRVADRRIDLIVSDVITPSLTGPEMGERLRKAGDRTPILFMSGYVDRLVPAGGVLQPGVNFLQKPFPPEALARKVREMLDESKSPEAA